MNAQTPMAELVGAPRWYRPLRDRTRAGMRALLVAGAFALACAPPAAADPIITPLITAGVTAAFTAADAAGIAGATIFGGVTVASAIGGVASSSFPASGLIGVDSILSRRASP